MGSYKVTILKDTNYQFATYPRKFGSSKDVSIKNAPGNLIDIRNTIEELLLLIEEEIIVSREYQ